MENGSCQFQQNKYQVFCFGCLEKELSSKELFDKKHDGMESSFFISGVGEALKSDAEIVFKHNIFESGKTLLVFLVLLIVMNNLKPQLDPLGYACGRRKLFDSIFSHFSLLITHFRFLLTSLSKCPRTLYVLELPMNFTAWQVRSINAIFDDLIHQKQLAAVGATHQHFKT